MAGLEAFKGTFPALITPLTEDESLDKPAFRRILESAVAAGVDGVVVLGSAGEGVSLSERVRSEVVEVAVDTVNGRVPVVVGTGDISTERVLQHNRQAKELGADAVIVVPPFYFPLPPQAVKAYYTRLADASAIPILLYHIPDRTQVPMPVPVVAELAKHPNIIGLKDSSGDMVGFVNMRLQTDPRQFRLFQGRAPLVVPSLAVGADGWITPVGNVDPQTEAALYAAWQKGDRDEAMRLQKRMADLAKVFGYGSLGVAPNIKAVLSAIGVCRNVLVHPTPAVTGDDLAKLLARVRELGLGDILER